MSEQPAPEFSEKNTPAAADDEINVRAHIIAFFVWLKEKITPGAQKLVHEGKSVADKMAPLLKDEKVRKAFIQTVQKKWTAPAILPKKKIKKTGAKKEKQRDTQAADELALFLFQAEMLKHPLRPGAVLAPLGVEKKRGGGGPDDIVYHYKFLLQGINTHDQKVTIAAQETVDDKYRSGAMSVRGDTALGMNYGHDSNKLWPALKAFHTAYLDDEKRNAKKVEEKEEYNPLKLTGA